jgi:CheY-like chemotaxis protein
VILMDCQMPELDGFEASKAIREAERTAGDGMHRPIIALTANAIKGDRELCLAAGMDDYVTKPIDPPELFNAIRNQLSAKRIAEIVPQRLAQSHTEESFASANKPTLIERPAALPVDLQSLQQRCMGNRKLASKALKIFETSLATDVGQLLESISKGDATGAAASAHKIKGSAANVSAEKVRVVAAELEKLAKADALGQAGASLEELDQEMKRFKEYLATALARLATPQDESAQMPRANTAKGST